MTFFEEYIKDNYPYGVRYKVVEESATYEGLEEYDPEDNNRITDSNLLRYTGWLYFSITDLTFGNSFTSSLLPDKKKTPKIEQQESCYANAKFGLDSELYPHYKEKHSLSFLGSNREIENFPFSLSPTESDEDVGCLIVTNMEHYDLRDINGKFSQEYFGLEVKISKIFFNNIKELVFSKKLQNLLLSIKGYEIEGLYENEFALSKHHKIRVLGDIDIVDNKDDLPEIFTAQDMALKPSKEFTLSYNTNIFQFESK